MLQFCALILVFICYLWPFSLDSITYEQVIIVIIVFVVRSLKNTKIQRVK